MIKSTALLSATVVTFKSVPFFVVLVNWLQSFTQNNFFSQIINIYNSQDIVAWKTFYFKTFETKLSMQFLLCFIQKLLIESS